MMKTSSSETTLTLPSERELMITHVFDAPREMVWKAMTDPAAIPLWWGPRQYETTVDKMDVRPGGGYRFVQHDAEGTEHAFRGEYREVTAPERLVQTFEYEAMAGHISVETATLEEIGGKTTITIVSRFDSVEDRDGMINSGMEGGMRETYERLDLHLANRVAAASGDLVVTRLFDAPRELMWKAWSEPEHFMRWYGPKSFTSPECDIDFREGGKHRFCMEMPDGTRLYTAGIYQTIDPMNQIVYTDAFSDEHGTPIPASSMGFSEGFPTESTVTVTFEEIAGKTLMTLRQSRLASGEVLDNAAMGWNQSFDKLAESLRD